jgi:hypothetical protein
VSENDPSQNDTDRSDREIHRTDYLLVSRHDETRVGVQVGDPPDEETPTIVDSRELRDALSEHLDDVEGRPETLSLVDAESGHQLLSADVVQWLDDEAIVVENLLTNPHTDFWEGDDE